MNLSVTTKGDVNLEFVEVTNHKFWTRSDLGTIHFPRETFM